MSHRQFAVLLAAVINMGLHIVSDVRSTQRLCGESNYEAFRATPRVAQ